MTNKALIRLKENGVDPEGFVVSTDRLVEKAVLSGDNNYLQNW